MAITWTTQRSGNWSLLSDNPLSPWYDAGTQSGYARTPGSSANANNDLVIIADGYTLTCDSSVTVGDATTPASLALSCATTSGTGILSVAAGVTLTVVSNVKSANANWTFSGGVGQASGLVLSSDSNLTWVIGDSGTKTSSKLTLAGVDGGRITVAKAGGGMHLINGGGSPTQFAAAYTDFTGLGDASHAAVNAYMAAAGASFVVDHCTFTSCGTIGTSSNISTNLVFSVTDSVFSSSAAAACIVFSSSTAIGTGTRLCSGNYLDKTFGSSSNSFDWTITGNILGSISCLNSNAFPWTAFSGNILRQFVASGPTFPGDTSASDPWNLLHVHNDSGTQITNIHVLGINTYRAMSFSGWIIDPGNTYTDGDLFQIPNPASSSYVTTLSNNLILPVGAGASLGKNCGQGFSALGGANSSIVWQHNTYTTSAQDGGESGAPSYGESYAGHTDIVLSCKSNLAWSATAQDGCVFSRRSISTVSDGLAAANATNNGTWNPVTADVGLYGFYQGVPGYMDFQGATPTTPMFSTTTGLGASDVIVTSNPFVDVDMSTGWWRNIAQYAVHAGLTRTAADGGGTVVLSDAYQVKVNAVYAWLAAQPASSNLAVAINAITDWIKAGWEVTAPSLSNAGHDGATIGALGYQASGPSATSYTLTAPSPASGYVGAASGDFSLQADAPPADSLVVTPASTGAGSFTPSTVTITDALAHTFTFTPSAAATDTISVTHTGGTGITDDPPSVAYDATNAPAPSSGGSSGASLWFAAMQNSLRDR